MMFPLLTQPLAETVTVKGRPGLLSATNGNLVLEVRSAGQYDVAWSGKKLVQSAEAEARLPDGRLLKTADYSRHKTEYRTVKDAFGRGVEITVHHYAAGKPELRQLFWLYENRTELIVRLDVIGAPGSNYVAPLTTAKKPELPGTLRTLFVPYDNDAYVHYRSDGSDETSHEVSALYNDDSRNGLVVGSIDHDLWKSGVFFGNGLQAFGGFTSKHTFDKQPHGTVTGKEIRSPRFALGYYADWRNGLERYGDLNAIVRPPLPWSGSVPFGWNSWASAKDKLNAGNARAATDFIAKELPDFRSGGTAYINLDSFWDNLKRPKLEEFIAHAHASGLKAGIYWTPFVWWGELNRKVDANHTYRDLVLKDAQGNPMPKLDGGWPLDPTHPLVLARIDRELADFVKLGYDFVKFDFMTHGSLEGKHADPKVTTGTAAYNVGMRRIAADLDPKRIGRPFFISLSIAPIFPQGYAHSRRVSCDVFANIGASEYLLNSSNYGWWTAGRLYAFNDPDHTVVYHPLGDPPTTEAEARTRFVASIVTGGMMLEGDDLGDPAAQARVRTLFTSKAMLDVARTGKPFRPVYGDTGDHGGESFVRQDGNTVYVAAFNFDKKASATKSIPLARLGLTGSWMIESLLPAKGQITAGNLTFELDPMDCALVKMTRKP